jgi:hypothetical protein
VIVQCFDEYGLVADFDAEHGVLRSKARPGALLPGHVDGWYSNLAHTCVVFYRSENRLCLNVADEHFELDGCTVVTWRQIESGAQLTVTDSARQMTLTYVSPGLDLADDLTPFVESEDFDFGLFIANVAADRDRSERIRTGAGR